MSDSYTTIVRFDVGYHTLFKCNLKMIRHDYPAIQRWLLHIYYDLSPEETRGAFTSTVDWTAVSNAYPRFTCKRRYPVPRVADHEVEVNRSRKAMQMHRAVRLYPWAPCP